VVLFTFPPADVLTVIAAPGIKAPVGSEMWPRRVPVVCGAAGAVLAGVETAASVAKTPVQEAFGSEPQARPS